MNRFLLSLSLTAILAACGDGKAPENALKERREAAQRRAGEILQGFDQRLADLRARADSGAANAKADVRRAFTELEEKKTAVQMKLEELKTASREAAGDAADGLERAVDDLDRSVKDASSRFR